MSHVLRRLPGRIIETSWRGLSSPLKVASNCQRWSRSPCLSQLLSTSATRLHEDKYEKAAKALNQKGLDEQEQKVKVRQHQVQRPWHREDADKPTVAKEGEEKEASTQGKSTHRHLWSRDIG